MDELIKHPHTGVILVGSDLVEFLEAKKIREATKNVMWARCSSDRVRYWLFILEANKRLAEGKWEQEFYDRVVPYLDCKVRYQKRVSGDPARNQGSAYLAGIGCSNPEHGSNEKWVQTNQLFTSQQHPCKTCGATRSAQANTGKKQVHAPVTVERVKEFLKSHESLDAGGISLTTEGKKSLKYVHGLKCRKHPDEVIAQVRYKNLQDGNTKNPCKKCKEFDRDAVAEQLKARGVIVKAFGAGIHSKAKCECGSCGHEWEAAVNNLVNRGDGCPECNKSSWADVELTAGLNLHETVRLQSCEPPPDSPLSVLDIHNNKLEASKYFVPCYIAVHEFKTTHGRIVGKIGIANVYKKDKLNGRYKGSLQKHGWIKTNRTDALGVEQEIMAISGVNFGVLDTVNGETLLGIDQGDSETFLLEDLPKVLEALVEYI